MHAGGDAATGQGHAARAGQVRAIPRPRAPAPAAAPYGRRVVHGRPGAIGAAPRTHRGHAAPRAGYRAIPLPLGSLRVRGGRELLHVQHARRQSLALELEGPGASTRLVLRGIPRRLLPVTVHPRPVDQVVDEPELVYSGRFRWRKPAQRIAPLPGLRRIVARGRTRRWIALRSRMRSRPSAAPSRQLLRRILPNPRRVRQLLAPVMTYS